MNYKHKFFFVFLLAAYVLPAQGYRKFSPGFELGLLASQVDGDQFGGYDKASLEAHLMVFQNKNRGVTWNMGIGLAQRGSFLKSDPDAGRFREYKMALHYLSAPFHVKIPLGDQFINRKRLAFFMQLGAQPLVNIAAQERDENGELPSRTDFNRITADGNFRLGVENKNYAVDFGFGYSLYAIRNIKSGLLVYDSNRKQYNRFIALRFSYKL